MAQVESIKIDMKSVICVGCRQPASLNQDNRCEFCRRVETVREHRVSDAQILLMTLVLVGLFGAVVWAVTAMQSAR